MPAQYEKIKQSLVSQGYGSSTSDPDVKRRASKIFISKGKGGSRHARAKSLARHRTMKGKR